MSKFDPTRDPPYYAVLSRCPPPGANAGQFLDAGERMIGLAAAEPGFLGIEETTGPDGTPYTVCYWRKSTSLRRWREEIQDKIPVGINVEDVVCFEGCLWHWLNDVFDAVARTETSNIVSLQKDERAA